MELLIVLALLVLLDVAALRWGADSRSTASGHLGAGGLLPQADTGPGGKPALGTTFGATELSAPAPTIGDRRPKLA